MARAPRAPGAQADELHAHPADGGEAVAAAHRARFGRVDQLRVFLLAGASRRAGGSPVQPAR